MPVKPFPRSTRPKSPAFPGITRRRALLLFAAAAGGTALPRPGNATPRAHWQGTAMGGDASIILDGFTDEHAADLIQAATGELSRLEQIFSLHRPSSDIVRLNETGHLSPAPAELVEALLLAADLNLKSGGAFDPTVQALWDVHAQSLNTDETSLTASPTKLALQAAQRRIGFHHIRLSDDQIRLSGGATLTLNGIAQGIITDRIAALFRSGGAHHTLINLGEFRANGPRQDGTPWRVGLRNPASAWKLDGKVEMTRGALATSAGSGHPLASGHHLFDPKSGASPTHYSSVSVSAPTAALADGLSTTLYILPIKEAFALTAQYGDTAARFTLADGQVLTTDGWRETAA